MFCSPSTLVSFFLAAAALMPANVEALPTRRAHSPLARRARDSSISLSGRAKRTTLGDFPVGQAGIQKSTINLTVIDKRNTRQTGNVFARIVRSLLKGHSQATAAPVEIRPIVVRKSLVVAELAQPAIKRVAVTSSPQSSTVISPAPGNSTAAHAQRMAAIKKKRIAAIRREKIAERAQLIASKKAERAAVRVATPVTKPNTSLASTSSALTLAPLATAAPVIERRGRTTILNPKKRRHGVASRSVSAEFAATTAQATAFAKFKRRVPVHGSSRF